MSATPSDNKSTLQLKVSTYIHDVLGVLCTKSAQERLTRVRVCNYVKIKTGQNFPSVLKIVTHTAQAA